MTPRQKLIAELKSQGFKRYKGSGLIPGRSYFRLGKLRVAVDRTGAVIALAEGGLWRLKTKWALVWAAAKQSLHPREVAKSGQLDSSLDTAKGDSKAKRERIKRNRIRAVVRARGKVPLS